jgi:hypothetical protein
MAILYKIQPLQGELYFRFWTLKGGFAGISCVALLIQHSEEVLKSKFGMPKQSIIGPGVLIWSCNWTE